MRDLVLTGKVIAVLPAQPKTQEFIIQTDEQYSKPVKIKAWLDKITPPIVGTTVTAHVRVESREYNGNWYNDNTAWRVDVGGAKQPATASRQDSFAPAEDDLPF
jgi:hypothetical protein